MELEHPNKTQEQRILEELQIRGTISNYDLHAMQPPIFQPNPRIWTLRKKGYDIPSKRDEKDRKKWWYSLRKEPKPYFPTNLWETVPGDVVVQSVPA